MRVGALRGEHARLAHDAARDEVVASGQARLYLALAEVHAVRPLERAGPVELGIHVGGDAAAGAQVNEREPEGVVVFREGGECLVDRRLRRIGQHGLHGLGTALRRGRGERLRLRARRKVQFGQLNLDGGQRRQALLGRGRALGLGLGGVLLFRRGSGAGAEQGGYPEHEQRAHGYGACDEHDPPQRVLVGPAAGVERGCGARGGAGRRALRSREGLLGRLGRGAFGHPCGSLGRGTLRAARPGLRAGRISVPGCLRLAARVCLRVLQGRRPAAPRIPRGRADLLGRLAGSALQVVPGGEHDPPRPGRAGRTAGPSIVVPVGTGHRSPLRTLGFFALLEQAVAAVVAAVEHVHHAGVAVGVGEEVVAQEGRSSRAPPPRSAARTRSPSRARPPRRPRAPP